MEVWNNAVPRALFIEPSSLREAANAAIQGMYSTVNTRKEKAVSVEGNTMCNMVVSSALVEAPVKTVKVLTTVSFAVIPVISAVDARQSAKPSGVKIGAMNLPMEASMLVVLSVTRLNDQSKLCKNQITMEARKMMVNALRIKSFAFSHMWSKTLLADGIL